MLNLNELYKEVDTKSNYPKVYNKYYLDESKQHLVATVLTSGELEEHIKFEIDYNNLEEQLSIVLGKPLTSLVNIDIHKDYRSKGLGSQLIVNLIKELKLVETANLLVQVHPLGCEHLGIDELVEVQEQLINFYTKLGFKELVTIETDNDEELNILLMYHPTKISLTKSTLFT